MLAADFDYILPPERIAQQPKPRGRSRLLQVDRRTGELTHGHIRDLVQLLRRGDCLVVNDTRVLPARLRARKEGTGAKIEVLLLQEEPKAIWQALVRPYKRVPIGAVLRIGRTLATVVSREGGGQVRLAFPSVRAARLAMAQTGEPPLPPYIRRPAGTDWRKDRKRYQTVFARISGSVAAPTAGLHFSPALLAALKRRGIRVVPVTLHVGLGTFAPLPEGPLERHELHAERFCLSDGAAKRINRCRRAGGRIVACGTTVARVLESAAAVDGTVRPLAGETRLFIRPGHRWRAVDALLTNFHLPRSSLLMLVCAFAGRERVLGAYAAAVRHGYDFYSYGDAMLLL